MADEEFITLEQYRENTAILQEGLETLDELGQYFCQAIQHATMFIPSDEEGVPQEIVDMADRWDEELAQFLASRTGKTLVDGRLNPADTKAVNAEIQEELDQMFGSTKFIFIDGEDPRDEET